jgi:hypothetical protein
LLGSEGGEGGGSFGRFRDKELPEADNEDEEVDNKEGYISMGG